MFRTSSRSMPATLSCIIEMSEETLAVSHDDPFVPQVSTRDE
jgi:hypothetical protein